jgi:hypothetical protein
MTRYVPVREFADWYRVVRPDRVIKLRVLTQVPNSTFSQGFDEIWHSTSKESLSYTHKISGTYQA